MDTEAVAAPKITRAPRDPEQHTYDIPFTYPPEITERVREVLNNLDFVSRYFIEREIASGKLKVLPILVSSFSPLTSCP